PLTELIAPDVFGLGQHHRRKAFETLLLRIVNGLLLQIAWLRVILKEIENLSRITAEKIGDQDDEENSYAAADRHPSRAHGPLVFDILTFPLPFPFHFVSPLSLSLVPVKRKALWTRDCVRFFGFPPRQIRCFSAFEFRLPMTEDDGAYL